MMFSRPVLTEKHDTSVFLCVLQTREQMIFFLFSFRPVHSPKYVVKVTETSTIMERITLRLNEKHLKFYNTAVNRANN